MTLQTSPIAPILETQALKAHEADLRIFDVTMVARAGAKGADTPDWCKTARVMLPDVANTAVRHPDGGLVARLAPGEVLLLGGVGQGRSEWIYAAMENLGAGQGLCFPMPRFDSHAWFVVAGEQAPQVFAKICGVDLRPKAFDDMAIAQTSVARINAIVIRDDKCFQDKNDGPCYHVLADWTSARSLWGYILDAMAEFGGRAASLDATA